MFLLSFVIVMVVHAEDFRVLVIFIYLKNKALSTSIIHYGFIFHYIKLVIMYIFLQFYNLGMKCYHYCSKL